MRKPFDGSYVLTQGFGENPSSYAKFGLKGHNGLDYGLPTGTNVKAPHKGKIVEATYDATGYGMYLKIENDKEGSILAHLKEFKVGVGDEVDEGQLVGISNNTGNSTGPHLHFGYYPIPRDRSNGYSGCIDQLPLLKPATTNPTAPQVDVAEYERVKKLLADNEQTVLQKQETIDKLNQLVDSKNNQISSLESREKSLSEQLTNMTSSRESAMEVAKRVPQLEKDLRQALNDRDVCLRSQENMNKSLAQKERRYQELLSSTPRLVIEYIAKLFKRK